MSKFKVGDRVRSSQYDLEAGTVIYVIPHDEVFAGQFRVMPDDGDIGIYAHDEIELIEPAPESAPAIDAHYTKYAIQPMEFSLANGLDAAQHTVIKYVVRYRDKGGVRDLRAAIRVLELMIEREEKAND